MTQPFILSKRGSLANRGEVWVTAGSNGEWARRKNSGVTEWDYPCTDYTYTLDPQCHLLVSLEEKWLHSTRQNKIGIDNLTPPNSSCCVSLAYYIKHVWFSCRVMRSSLSSKPKRSGQPGSQSTCKYHFPLQSHLSLALEAAWLTT